MSDSTPNNPFKVNNIKNNFSSFFTSDNKTIPQPQGNKEEVIEKKPILIKKQDEYYATKCDFKKKYRINPSPDPTNKQKDSLTPKIKFNLNLSNHQSDTPPGFRPNNLPLPQPSFQINPKNLNLNLPQPQQYYPTLSYLHYTQPQFRSQPKPIFSPKQSSPPQQFIGSSNQYSESNTDFSKFDCSPFEYFVPNPVYLSAGRFGKGRRNGRWDDEEEQVVENEEDNRVIKQERVARFQQMHFERQQNYQNQENDNMWNVEYKEFDQPIRQFRLEDYM